MATEVTDAIAAVRTALEGEDTDAIKSAHDDLVAKAQKIGEAVYASQQAAAADASQSPSADADDDVVDAEIVDEDETK